MNMKCKLLAAAAAGALVVGSSAFADAMADVRPYVGAELSYNMAKYNDSVKTSYEFKKSKPGFGLNVGARICDFFGVEAGYNQVLKAKSKATGKDASVKVNNMYLDGMGYFAASPEVDLIGAVGIGRMKAKFSNTTGLVDNVAKAKTSYRLGAGLQYKFDENLAARLMVRHQKGNKEGLKNLNSVALGVAYSF